METTEWLQHIVTGVAGLAGEPKACIGLMALYVTARKGGYPASNSAMGIIKTFCGFQSVVR